MITIEQIKTEIAKFLKKDVALIKENVPLRDLVAESFVLIEMIIELQDIFAIRLNQEDLIGVQTLGDLATVLEKIGNKSGPAL
jgi:acyl carrier protein